MVIEVVRNPIGWWEVRGQAGRVAARYVAEFQAWEAGRALAEHCGADLMIHPEHGPVKHEEYDAQTRTVRPVDDPSAAQSTDVTPSRRHLILLVEDALDTREMYAEYLNYAGFSVVTAVNGHEALRLARILRPDLILMDIRLPRVDGLEATADLRGDRNLSHIPIVAITGDTSDEVCERARAAGCTAFISKPALPQHVATYLTQMLKGEAARVPDLAERT